jgi:hypothetical protein
MGTQDIQKHDNIGSKEYLGRSPWIKSGERISIMRGRDPIMSKEKI